MGQTESAFTEDELLEYKELTYFSEKEILEVFKRFSMLDPKRVKEDKHCRIDREKVLELKELKVNPFKDRIVEVFASCATGDMSFEDFLDMMSVFSDNAPKSVKVEYAFRIFDFDGDDCISASDLHEVGYICTTPDVLFMSIWNMQSDLFMYNLGLLQSRRC